MSESDQMEHAVVLVDFDNVYHNERTLEEKNWLARALQVLEQSVMNISESVHHIEIRLYGGWLQNGNYTRRASKLLGEVGRVTRYPVPHPFASGLLRGSIELPITLVSLPAITWANTFYVRTGLPRLRIDMESLPDTCSSTHRARCPALTLRRFTRKRTQLCPVEGCTLSNSAVFRVNQQKMVDTLMACDLMHYSLEGKVRIIMVVTNDLDLLPAIAMSASYPNTTGDRVICLAGTSTSEFSDYRDQLDDIGVRTINLRSAII